MTEKTQLDKATEPGPKDSPDDKKREANPADRMKPESAPAGSRPGPENAPRARPYLKSEPDETKPYRLKEGKRHAGLKPGDEIELTETQAKAFRDKFEAVDEKRRGPSPEQLQAEQSQHPTAAATSHMPQDVGAKTEVPDLNVGNKVSITK